MMKFKANGFIKLENLLKVTGIVGTGGQAKLIIQDGQVKVNGEICTARGRKLYVGDKVYALNESIEVI